MTEEPVKLRVRENVRLEKYEGDVQTPEHLTEVIELQDGEIVNHWKREEPHGPN